MAFNHVTDQEVYDLRDALEEYQEENGTNEFVEGALAVCSWMAEGIGKPAVEDFLKANDLVG